MPDAFAEIQAYLKHHGTAERVAASQRFFPETISSIYGVAMPALNALARQYKKEGFALAEKLWKAGAFEEQILAGKLLEQISKTDPARALQLVERFSGAITNWAVCDCLGMQALRGIVKTHSKEIFTLATRLGKSNNYWQRRLSLVLVEWYTRDKTYHPAIHKLVTQLENDKEYYVKKAITWIRKNFKKGK
jgi:3-methyladenine DNA glycosylase AlkD